MLQLKLELPRANQITPSQVSTLEPLLGTLLGSPWCPPNHTSSSSELVVVPLCFELKLIKHKGGASLSDVGLCKMSMPTLAKRTKPCGVSSLIGYKVQPLAWGKNPPKRTNRLCSHSKFSQMPQVLQQLEAFFLLFTSIVASKNN